MPGRIDHKLLDKFLAYVLDGYKSGNLTRTNAIATLAHLVAALDLPQGDDPIGYMKAILAGEGEDD